MGCKLIGVFIYVLLIVACVQDEIVINVISNGTKPVFDFIYVREPNVPVAINEFSVKETGTGKVVWRLRPINWEAEPHELVIPNKIIFAEIPAGFSQQNPGEGHMPILEQGTIYVVEAGGG